MSFRRAAVFLLLLVVPLTGYAADDPPPPPATVSHSACYRGAYGPYYCQPATCQPKPKTRLVPINSPPPPKVDVEALKAQILPSLKAEIKAEIVREVTEQLRRELAADLRRALGELPPPRTAREVAALILQHLPPFTVRHVDELTGRETIRPVRLGERFTISHHRPEALPGP